MMRPRPRFALWHRRLARPRPPLAGAGTSVALHLLLVYALAGSVAQAPVSEPAWVTEVLRFLVPENRVRSGDGRAERLTWVEVGGGLAGAAASPGDAPRTATEGAVRGRIAEEAEEPEAPSAAPADSVYSILDVERTVERHPWSAAPAYPEALRSRGVEGEVFARYVVDTTGRVDPASFVVLFSSDTLFSAAVLAAVPDMRFAPARIGSTAVRQLVEQRFAFKLVASGDAGRAVARAAPPR